MKSWDDVTQDIESGPRGSFKWFLTAVVLLALVFGGIRWATMPADMAIKRVVMKQSFQYKEGMEQRAAILQASIAEIDIAMQQNPANSEDLTNQRRILSAQLNAITINQ